MLQGTYFQAKQEVNTIDLVFIFFALSQLLLEVKNGI